MKTLGKRLFALCVLAALCCLFAMPVLAASPTDSGSETAVGEMQTEEKQDATGEKAMAAAICAGLAAAAGAIGMGIAISKSSEGISRQPEAENKIRTNLMLGLVFVETAIIYALIVAILIIFVL